MSPDSHITVREARPEDVDVLARLNLAMARETENRSLDPVRLREGTAAVFATGDKGYYILAEVHGRVVGSLLVTYEWSDWRNGVFWWIQSVYVEPEWRRKKVYSTMHSWVYAAARSRPDVCGLRLYVHVANEDAQRTYKSLGFESAEYYLYEMDFTLSHSPNS